MFGRVVLALIASPAYGVLVALCALPVTLIGNVIVSMFGVTAILLPLLVIVAAFLVQVAIWVQTARYAASFTGLMKFQHQPDYFSSVGKGMMISFLGLVLLALVMVAIVLVFLEFRGGEALWWLNPNRLSSALQVAMVQPDRLDGIFSFDGFDLEGLLVTVRVTYMVFLTVMSLFIVPLSCGIRWGTERTYNLGLILVRFLIAMPFFFAMVGIMGHWIVVGLDFLLTTFFDKVALILFVRYGIELALFAGMIFAFEALLLRTGAEQEEVEAEIADAEIQKDMDEIRALRHARMHR